MQSWTLSAAAPHAEASRGLELSYLAARLIGGVGSPSFSDHVLGILNDAWSFASWSVYRIGGRHPRMFVSGSFGVPDTTEDCWLAYRSGLHRHDQTFRQVLRGRPSELALTHWRAEEIRRPHREQIYVRHGLRERISVAQACSANEVLAVNLYRHEHEGSISPQVVRDLQFLAPILFATVQRHLELLPGLAPNPAPVPLREALLAQCPTLTEREIQVCLRLLRGLTYDGIAADLGISATTAKTYRNRAFRRMGLQHRNQLFELMLEAGAAPTVLPPED